MKLRGRLTALAAVSALTVGSALLFAGSASAGPNGQQIYFTNDTGHEVTVTVTGRNQNDQNATWGPVQDVPPTFVLRTTGWWWKTVILHESPGGQTVYAYVHITWSGTGTEGSVTCNVPAQYSSNWYNCGSF
jgi:hypothetical protein